MGGGGQGRACRLHFPAVGAVGIVVEQAVQIEAVVERGESLDCDAFGPQLLQALALQRVFDIGPRRPRRGRAQFLQGQKGIVVAHALADGRRPGQRHFGTRAQRVGQCDAKGCALERCRCAGDQFSFAEFGRPLSADQVQVAAVCADPAQIETEFGRVVAALLGRWRAGEEMPEARPGEGGRRRDGIAHRPQAIAKGEVYVSGEEPLGAIL